MPALEKTATGWVSGLCTLFLFNPDPLWTSHYNPPCSTHEEGEQQCLDANDSGLESWHIDAFHKWTPK